MASSLLLFSAVGDVPTSLSLSLSLSDVEECPTFYEHTRFRRGIEGTSGRGFG